MLTTVRTASSCACASANVSARSSRSCRYASKRARAPPDPWLSRSSKTEELPQTSGVDPDQSRNSPIARFQLWL